MVKNDVVRDVTGYNLNVPYIGYSDEFEVQCRKSLERSRARRVVRQQNEVAEQIKCFKHIGMLLLSIICLTSLWWIKAIFMIICG